MSLNPEGLCRQPILSRVIPPTAAAYLAYASKALIIETCIQRFIQNEELKDLVQRHYNLVWALVSSWFIANIFRSFY